MLIWYNGRRKPPNLQDIEDFCIEQQWRCTETKNVKGSEASVTILYDLYGGYYSASTYECLTRARTQLFIITICGQLRYFL